MGAKKEKLIIGWREWVSLPGLGVKEIKAKIDTGARSSSLHAYDLEFYKRKNKKFVRFTIHPEQRNTRRTVRAHAEVFEFRKVRSSNGQVDERPVIITDINLMGKTWKIELTLANRDEMGFRMLLGRESFREQMLVDAGSSYYGKKKQKKAIIKKV